MHVSAPATLLALLLPLTATASPVGTHGPASAPPGPAATPLGSAGTPLGPARTAVDPAEEDNNGGGEQVSCTAQSKVGLQWMARSFDFQMADVFTTQTEQHSWGSVSFDLYNPADSSTVHCKGESTDPHHDFFGTRRFECDDRSRVGTTHFDWNSETKTLRLSQTWTCAVKHPDAVEGTPLRYSGYSEGELELNCSEHSWQNEAWKQGEVYSTRKIQCSAEEHPVPAIEVSIEYGDA